MATDLGPQIKPAPKYETFVEQQLMRARGRIRALDVAAIGLVLLLGTLVYCLAVTLLDQALDLPVGVRLAAFLVYVGAALFYLARAGFRLLSWRVNPYYAARRIEQTLPDAKNSVVNWLDLRGANLPPVIRGALGQRAARDLKQADFDRALSTRRTTWLGGGVLGLLLVVLVLFVMGGGQFLSLLARAFAPFQEVAIATRTTLTLLQPEGGDVTVPVGRPVTFRVHVAGREPQVNQPDALRLYYRYNPTDPYVPQGLEKDVDGEWTTTLLADQVQGGLWYQIRGGDAETPEYQVRARAQVQVTSFDVKYHYRPYRNRADRVVHYPNQDAVVPHLRAHRGTEVTLTARANRAVAEGKLEMDFGGVKKDLPAQVLAGQPEVLRFQFPLESSGSYRVLFTTTDRDPNTDRAPYSIEVLTDRAPLVQLTKPGKDVELPANGTLALEGRAEDDFGITTMTLRLRVQGGQVLKAKDYRPGKSFRLENGAYPDVLDYKDFIELEKVKTDAGVPFALAPGMELKYWLEARDNCDYPSKIGNLGRTKEYTVKIVEPTASPQQQQERQQAQQAQQKHEQRQDQKLQKQNEARTNADQQDGPGSQAKDGSGQGAGQEQKDFEKKARQLENALKEKEQQDANKAKAQDSNPSQAQGANQQPGQEGAGANPGAAKEKQPSDGQDTGSQKDRGKNETPGNKAQANEQSASATGKAQPPGQARDGGKEKPGDSKASAKSDGAASKQESAAAGAKGTSKQAPGEQKGQAKAGQEAPASQTKDGGREGANQQRAEGRDGGKQSGQNPKAIAKENGTGNTGSTPKEAGNAKAAPREQVAQAKDLRGSGQKTDASKTKSEGPPQAGKQPTGQDQVKGQELSSAKPTAKNDGAPNAGQQKGTAKEGNGSGGPPQAKNTKTDQAPSPGMASGDRPSPQQASDKNKVPGGDATKEDVAKWKEALKEGKQAQQAADALSRMAKEARDPQVRKAAEDALKEAAAQAQALAREASKEDVAQLQEALKRGNQKQAAAALSDIAKEARDPQVRKAAQDALKEAAAQAKALAREATQEEVAKLKKALEGQDDKEAAGEVLSRIAEEARDPQVRKAAEDVLKEIGDQAKTPGTNKTNSAKNDTAKRDSENTTQPAGVPRKPGAGHFDDKYRHEAGNEDFARRGGVLQLEDLKKKVTPDLLKQLNWTEKDWQQFQEQARRYETARQKPPPLAGKDKIRSGSSLLPSTGPRQVGADPDARRDDVTGGQALPPPEFRKAQAIFTSRPEGTPAVTEKK